MPRTDLQHLSADDLAALTNRGTVKRAQRELEAAEVTGEVLESEDGTVTAAWSDGVKCTLPGGKVVAEARCTCPATDVCRHIVRTVMAYQKRPAQGAAPDISVPWNPGDIGDEDLAKHFKPAALGQARAQFQRGLLIELVRSHKPTVRFHDLACTLRFQVRGDVRYVYCDCAAAPPCVHVPLAVWAFRQLPAGQGAGILSTQTQALPVPTGVLDQIDEVMLEGAEAGLAGGGSAWRDRLARLEASCRDAGLIWPAEVVTAIIYQYERYSEHDSLFNPDALVELVGELLVRADAIRHDTGAVPQPLVRGTAADHGADLGSARFIGVGCGVRPGRRVTTVVAYLQDANSGSMAAVSRAFPDAPADSTEGAKPFWQLALTPVFKGASFAQLGAGQLLTSGGRRTTDHHLLLGRARATVNPQNFSWEQLRPPVLAENFAEIRARLGVLPPASLRPRRVAEDFHVCAVARVERAAFRSDLQAIEAVVLDASGDRAVLRHPFTNRGNTGGERLLARLSQAPEGLRFVAGPMRLAADGLLIEPVALVWDGPTRTVLQPWIDREEGTGQTRPGPLTAGHGPLDPIEEWKSAFLSGVASLLVTGLRRADGSAERVWQELDRRAAQLGLERLRPVVRAVASGLAQKPATLHWQPRPTARHVLELAALARVSQEVMG